jgi:hypothetical protein
MENSFAHRKGKGVDVSRGRTKKGKGDVIPIPGVINTPLIFGETTPISTRGNNVVNPLDFMIELVVLHKNFSWAF